METEQSVSKISRNPPLKMVKSSSFFEELKNLENSFNFRPRGQRRRFAEFFQKKISSIYKSLDSFCGCPSYFLMDFPDNFYFPRFRDILQQLMKKKFVKEYRFSRNRYNDAPFFFWVNLISNYQINLTDGLTIEAMGSSSGKNPEEVFSKAIGEFLERYFLTLYQQKNFVRGSIKSLKKSGKKTLDLNLLAGFSSEQKQMKPSLLQFNEESIFYWEKAKRALTGETVWLPAQMIYWNYKLERGEPFLQEVNTNGAAGGFSQEEAVLSGLYELIQRDSFCIFWLNQLSPQKVELSSIPHQGFQQIVTESQRYGFEIHCLNITSDIGLPIFAAVVSDPSGQSPRFSVGADAQTDPQEALYLALLEAWSVYFSMRELPFFQLPKDFKPFQEKVGREDRLRLWADPAMADFFEFFIAGEEKPLADFEFDYPQKFVSATAELKFLVRRLEGFGQGYEVFYFLASHPFLSQVGYWSAQVVVPRLVSLYLEETNAPLGSQRLKEMPEKIGFSTAEKFNPYPHPFP
jgi:ribosomal protein S12 methylthiotransferase accessory factor